MSGEGIETAAGLDLSHDARQGVELIGWLGVGQVGLKALRLSPTGSQQRVSRTLPNPLASGFPWREHAVISHCRAAADGLPESATSP